MVYRLFNFTLLYSQLINVIRFPELLGRRALVRCRGNSKDIDGDPFYESVSTLMSAGKNNYMHGEVWDELTYPFPNFNCCTFQAWERTSYFLSLYNVLITYPQRDLSYSMFVKGVTVSCIGGKETRTMVFNTHEQIEWRISKISRNLQVKANVKWSYTHLFY